ncbi:hypothetical protein [Kitasatospora sp. GP82]|uniref:hypothetical protein n=1 Tax=Kitasatospora sp. GP82 TaxID=3035089 RepID=UPI002475F3F3|nr:hypothetical protein [Kitasatospora sp. GP82]MDH6127031.1 cytochrome c-type biogenesis protein CcmH/NrfG [Kitasatospora sp. GP82]
MEAEIAALATSGATTLVGLMATDLWTQVRGRFASLFGRDRAEEIAEELDEVREELRSSGDSAASAAEWARRLRRALATDPQAAEQLRDLLAEFGPAAEDAAAVRNVISGGTFHGTVVQSGRVENLTIGQEP